MRATRILLAGLLAPALLVPATTAVPAAETHSATYAGTYTGLWLGHTGQDRLFKFRVNSANRVTVLVVSYKINGGYCTVTGKTSLQGLSAAINSLHKFTVRKTSANTTIVAKGTMLTASKAKGTVKVTLTDPTGFGCAGSVSTSWVTHKS